MRRSLWALAVAVGAWPLTGASASSAAADTTPAIAAVDALLHVKTLTGPEMEGRGALTPGLDRAAAYVAARFRGMGLTGAGDGGTFFEAVDLPLPRRAGPLTALRIGGRPLALGRDFAPNLGAAAASAHAGVVFAGYGISIVGGYDDYAAIDARGQLVICLRYAPHYDVAAGHAADPAFNAGATLRAKVEDAIRHGAVAIAIVDPPVPAAPPPSGDAAPLPVGAPGATNIASFHPRDHGAARRDARLSVGERACA